MWELGEFHPPSSESRICTLRIPDLQSASIEHLLVYGTALVAVSSSTAGVSTKKQPLASAQPAEEQTASQRLFSFDLESLELTRSEGVSLEVFGSVEAVLADEHGIWMSAAGGISFFPSAV